MAATTTGLLRVYLTLLLLMGGALFYITTFSHLPLSNLKTNRQEADYRVEARTCHQHVHLCWLRHVLTTVFNQTMSHDVFDMTSLYKFQAHVFLDYAEYHNTAIRVWPNVFEKNARAKKVLQYMRDEAFINGHQRPLLNLDVGIDIDGRKCSYNPLIHYSYTYQMYHTHDRVLVYLIETPLGRETVKNMPNYIKGTVRTKLTVSSCENIDFFTNRTYLFNCPVLEGNPTVSIEATYISTATSDFQCNGIITPIWTLKEFPVELKYKSDVNNSAKSKCTSGRGHERGFWLKVGALSHWATNSCYYPYHFEDRQLKCLNKKSVLMFGDSHTERRYEGLTKAYKLDRLVQHRTAVTMALLIDLLKVYKNCLNRQCPDVLVANIGHHDLRRHDFIAYIAGMSDIFKMLKRFKTLKNPPQIIWIEILPVAENGFHGRMMTNQAVDGLNDWVNHQMKQLGVDIIHSFKIAIPMTSQSYDGNHYRCFLGPKVNGSIDEVNVGGVVASVMVNMICPLC